MAANSVADLMYYKAREFNIKQFYLNRISYIYAFVQYHVVIYEKDSI